MKVVILCGGLGTRISEETNVKPKPMVKIGNKPILIHIINYYQKFGLNHFVLAMGYKKKFIINYFKKKKFNFKLDLIDTGKNTLTGGRLLRLKKYLEQEENFMLTYGDGLSNVNISKLLKFHKKNKKTATLTAVRPPVRFGELKIGSNAVVYKFEEKPNVTNNWINGGFFVFNKKIFKYLKNDKTILERDPVINLTKKRELIAFKHNDFWQCMDTLRDKKLLNKIWNDKRKKAPWK